jgi:hypothetical protein
MSASKVFDIPKYYYFEAGNSYLGSLNGMNFKIDNTEEELVVYLYYGVKSFELSTPYTQKSFPKSEEGYAELIPWLENEYQTHTQTEHFTTRIRLL